MGITDRDRRIAKVCSETTEPCIVFRGKDKLLPDLLEKYAEELIDAGASQEMVDAIEQRRNEVLKWQEDNTDRVKVPDLRPGEKITL